MRVIKLSLPLTGR